MKIRAVSTCGELCETAGRNLNGTAGNMGKAPPNFLMVTRRRLLEPDLGELTFATKTDDDTERQLVHTLAHAIVFIVSICYLQNFGGAIYLPPFFSNGPANKRRAGPSCDDLPVSLRT